MNPGHRRLLLGFILLFGFCARAATYNVPLLDHHGWRQADTASISRNFFRERFNLLYPQVDQRGAQRVGYVETGLELFAFLVATLSVLVGFHYQTGRLLSAVFFIGSCLLVWSFVRRRYGDRSAVVASFLYAFGFPLMLFIERAFMNESLLVFLSLACLNAAQRYLDRRSPIDLFVLVAASSLVGAIKLPYLIIWAPIAGLFLEREGPGIVRRWELYVLAAANLIAAAAWYAHARDLALVTGLTFGMSDKLFDGAVVFSLEHPATLFRRFWRDILGPLGLAGLAIGTWRGLREKRWCETFGLAGFGAYLVLVARGNFHHDYYQLAITPVAPLLVGRGIEWLSDRICESRPEWRMPALGILLGAAVVSTFVRHVSAHSWYEYRPEDLLACNAIREALPPDERVVFVGTNNPQMLFCIDRKGWLIAAHELSEDAVRRAHRQGARAAIVPRSLDSVEIRGLLSESGDLALKRPAVDVYRLK